MHVVTWGKTKNKRERDLQAVKLDIYVANVMEEEVGGGEIFFWYFYISMKQILRLMKLHLLWVKQTKFAGTWFVLYTL